MIVVNLGFLSTKKSYKIKIEGLPFESESTKLQPGSHHFSTVTGIARVIDVSFCFYVEY